MTYKELQSKLTTLTDEQLSQTVLLFSNDRPEMELNLRISKEDCLAHIDDLDDWWSRSDFELIMLGQPEDRNDYVIIFPAGTVILS